MWLDLQSLIKWSWTVLAITNFRIGYNPAVWLAITVEWYGPTCSPCWQLRRRSIRWVFHFVNCFSKTGEKIVKKTHCVNERFVNWGWAVKITIERKLSILSHISVHNHNKRVILAYLPSFPTKILHKLLKTCQIFGSNCKLIKIILLEQAVNSNLVVILLLYYKLTILLGPEIILVRGTMG